MGLMALPLLPLTWRTPEQGWGLLLLGMALSIVGYLSAQGLFYWTVRFVAASRLAPLLGIKVAFVALLALALGNDSFGCWQWVALGLSLVAVLAIQAATDPVPFKGLCGIVGTAACFAVSDNGIGLMHRGLGAAGHDLFAPFFVLSITYVALLPLALTALLILGRPRQQPWRASLPYALLWFGSMVALYTGFGFAGVVLTVLCQAMRGPLSLFIALGVARLGWHHLEAPQGRGQFLRQVLAALLMTTAIALYLKS
jgi:drug/metabolite transporter (DMT)-like permease